MAWKKREESREYKLLKAKVRRRDKYRCQLCGDKKRLEVHHLYRYADNVASRESDIDLLICLCSSCHKMVTGRESFYSPLLHEIIMDKKKKKK